MNLWYFGYKARIQIFQATTSTLINISFNFSSSQLNYFLNKILNKGKIFNKNYDLRHFCWIRFQMQFFLLSHFLHLIKSTQQILNKREKIENAKCSIDNSFDMMSSHILQIKSLWGFVNTLFKGNQFFEMKIWPGFKTELIIVDCRRLFK